MTKERSVRALLISHETAKDITVVGVGFVALGVLLTAVGAVLQGSKEWDDTSLPEEIVEQRSE